MPGAFLKTMPHNKIYLANYQQSLLVLEYHDLFIIIIIIFYTSLIVNRSLSVISLNDVIIVVSSCYL